jgi:hypothetical protein
MRGDAGTRSRAGSAHIDPAAGHPSISEGRPPQPTGPPTGHSDLTDRPDEVWPRDRCATGGRRVTVDPDTAPHP